MTLTSRSDLTLGAFCLIALLGSGCSPESKTVLEPSATSQGGASRAIEAGVAGLGTNFYPLAKGNRWHYSRIFNLYLDGYQIYTVRTSTDLVNVGTESRSGVAYFVEEETSTQDTRPGEVFKFWYRYRQDQAGLYYPDVCLCEPPTMASKPSSASLPEDLISQLDGSVPMSELITLSTPLKEMDARLNRMRSAVKNFAGQGAGRSGEATDEITLLPYPIHVGKRWQVRPDLELYWAVERFEVLETPAGKFPAFKIRVSYGSDGPEDYAYVWYGRGTGRLAYQIHVSGGPEVTFSADEYEAVDRLDISRPNL